MFSHPALRGRDAELAVIDEALVRAREGQGATIFVAGPSGFGKTRLLEHAAASARATGFRIASGVVEANDHLVPMGALIDALIESEPPFLDRSTLRDLHVLPEQRYWLLQDLEALLERAALEAPILICLDDLQWADNGCLAAIRALPQRLAGLPIVWLLAFRADEAPPELRSAVGRLADAIGAQSLRLGQLDDAAVAQVVADVVGAEADAALLEIAERAGGNPFLLVELILGLLEEGLVQVDSGVGVLLAARLPARVRDSMRDRLARMSPQARQVARVASVLGRRFTFANLGAMLETPPSALLGAVDELLRLDLLTEVDGGLAFRHDLIREAVRDTLPTSAQRALQRQAVEMLLASGSSPIQVAPQLAETADAGDELAITTLFSASAVLGTTDPGAAADLSQRALELAPPEHPLRGPLVARSAILLHAAGRGREAKTFADIALHDALPAEQEAEVLLSIAEMFALSPDVRVDAGRQALDLPDLPRGLHARHVARLVHNLLAAGLLEEARAEFGEARAAVRSSGETAAAYSLQLTEAALDYTDGRFERSLDLTDAALRAGPGGGEDTVQRFAQQWRCGALTVLDRLDESLRAAADGVAAAQRDRQAWALHAFEAGRGRLLLQMGRLQDAAATLEGQFGPADADAMPAISDAAGVVALGRVALHTGDRSQTRRTAETARAMLEQGAPGVRRHAAWLLALQAMAEGDAFGARAWLCALGVEQRTSLLPLFPADITDEAHLVRIAVAADDLELAESATAAAERRAAINPGVRSILATAAHARGLQHGDRRALEQAVQLFESGPRPLALASALEDLGVASVDRGSEEERIEAFSRALVLYSHAGAVWDAGRVRGRLRALGVRRRLVTPARPARGWAGLTDAELAVVRIVAEGLSNREASQRLFLSPHTVSSHLRHAFNKLGINSRVELTRMVLTHDRAD